MIQAVIGPPYQVHFSVHNRYAPMQQKTDALWRNIRQLRVVFRVNGRGPNILPLLVTASLVNQAPQIRKIRIPTIRSPEPGRCW